jgi:oligopeptidase A
MDLNSFIPFTTISISDLEEAIVKYLDKTRATLKQVESMKAVSWEYLQDTLYLDLYKLNQIWGILGHLESVNDTEEIRCLQEKYQPKITEFYVSLGQNSKLYAHYQSIKENEYASLDPEAQRIIDNEFRDFFLNGISLENNKQLLYKTLQSELNQLSTKFAQNNLDATDRYIKYVSLNELSGIPLDTLKMFKDASTLDGKEDLYKITLHMPSYLPVMQYCDNRELLE